MSTLNTATLIAADKAHLWHPFTQMKAWGAAEHEPLVLVDGEGAMLRDSEGREYIDGNSSIWTNIHGHRHPKITAAIKAQACRGSGRRGVSPALPAIIPRLLFRRRFHRH